MNATYSVNPPRVSPPQALSVALLLSSALWFVSSWVYYYATSASDWSVTPLMWMLLAVMTPAVCFALGMILVGTRKHTRFSWLGWCALVAAFLPVTLGSLLALRAVKALLSMSGLGL